MLRIPPSAPRGIRILDAKRWKWRLDTRASLAAKVPFSDYSASYRFSQEELFSELERAFALRTDREIWEYLESFAADYARSLGLAHGVGTSSGTTALTFALLALGVEPGDEVLIPSYTFVATGLAVRNAGAVPIFVDLSASGPHLDPGQLALKRGPRTKGVVAVHLFGGMSDPEPLVHFCRSEGLFLLEDACQAHALRWKGRPAGSFGDAAAFSFGHTKLVSGLGNGGIFVTSDEEYRRRVRLMRDPEGASPWVIKGGRTPGYLDPLQVACVRAQAASLDRILAHRSELAEVYARGLAEFPLALPRPESPGAHTWWWYVIRTRHRDALATFLMGRGIEARVKFFEPLPRLSAFRDLPGSADAYPNSESFWNEAVALPIGIHLDPSDVQCVVEAVKAFFADRTSFR